MGVDAQGFIKIKGRDNWLTDEEIESFANALEEACPDAVNKLADGQQWGLPRSLNLCDKAGPHYDGWLAEHEGEEREIDPANRRSDRFIYTQDGPDILAGDDEQFIEFNLSGRYFSPGYPRGWWPKYVRAFLWVYANIPACEIWYGGDSSGCCVRLITEELLKEFTVAWNAKHKDDDEDIEVPTTTIIRAAPQSHRPKVDALLGKRKRAVDTE